MSEHLKEIPPAAVLLGREIISVDARSGEVQLRFLADRQFANRYGTIQGGMKAKVKSILEVLRSGVKGVHLIDGRVPHSIIGELFTDRGVGSWITA